MIQWGELVQEVGPLRERGLSVEKIARRLGVSAGAFREFRRHSGIKIRPIPRSKTELVGWHDPIVGAEDAVE